MIKRRIDYSGEIVHVGIDVHKKTFAVCCLCEDEVVKKATLPADPIKLVEFLGMYLAGAKINSAYEAGFSGFALHRVLMGHGINNIVVNAASIEVAAKDKVKTDKRDCKKIATQLAAGRLHGIYVPSIEQEENRLLTRTRELLVKERTRFGHRFKSRLYQFGLIPFNDETVLSKKMMLEYLQTKPPEKLSDCLDTLFRMWQAVDEEISTIERKMRVRSKHDKLDMIYQSVPGIGPICGQILSNELGNMSQFRNERTIFSHTGLTPSEFSSGNSIRQGHITHQGSSRLRWVLTEASWRAIKQDPKLREDFNRIALKRGKKRAIVAIARKLIGRIRACIRSGEMYKLGHGMAA
jgi:transposase